MSEITKKTVPVLTDEIVDDYSAEDFVFVQQNERLTDKVYEATSYLRDVWINFSKNKGDCYCASLWT